MELVSIYEAAKRLRVTDATLRNRVKRGELLVRATRLAGKAGFPFGGAGRTVSLVDLAEARDSVARPRRKAGRPPGVPNPRAARPAPAPDARSRSSLLTADDCRELERRRAKRGAA